jgi:hypothetical protein
MEATHSLNTCNNMAAPVPCRTSQLCKPLIAILKDSEAGSAALSMLEYFVQYMEEQDALHLLQFWFAVESFKTVAPSPKHTAMDCSQQLTDTSARAQTGDHKQCDTTASSVETSVNGHMTRQTIVPIEEDRSNPAECEVLNPTRITLNDTVANTVLNEGTRQCVDNNIEGRKNMTLCSTTSDTLQGQREAAAAISCDAATPQSPTQGIRVHPRRLLKQLSLSKEACSYLVKL